MPDVGPTGVHSARRYNYWLGGTSNFEADRASGDAIATRFPSVPLSARENRKFLGRAVKYLATEAGVRQFLDIGTGIPAPGNTHEVAPDAQVVYVDNDPLVLAHAKALLSGSTSYVEADFRDPEKILDRAAETLDFSQPVGLMLVAILHFMKERDQPRQHVARLLEALPSGSYLTLSNATLDFAAPEDAADARQMLGHEMEWRSSAVLASFFTGLELVEPGIVPVSEWRAAAPFPARADVSCYGAVGRIP
jgi:hypothetical protein